MDQNDHHARINGKSKRSLIAFKSRRLLFAVLTGFVSLLLFGTAFGQSWSTNTLFGNWDSVVLTADGSEIAADAYLTGIYTSINSGTNWTGIGSPGLTAKAVLSCSTNGSFLAAAYYGDGIYTSTNWGQNWLESSAPIADWNCLASSWDGTRLAAGLSPGQIFTSTDSGKTFTSRLPQNQAYQALAASADGQDLIAVVLGGGIYRSVDAGETWAQLNAPGAEWSAVASSASGMNLAATTKTTIYTATNAGVSWQAVSAPNTIGWLTNGVWSAINSSGDGSRLVAALNVTNYYYAYTVTNYLTTNTFTVTNYLATNYTGSNKTGKYFAGALIYVSSDYGDSWLTSTSFVPGQLVSAVAGSADGTHLVAVTYGASGGTNGGFIYYSTNSALTWTPDTNAPETNWSAVAASTDGSQLAATVDGGSIYTSSNFGQDWSIPTGLVVWSTNASSASPTWVTNLVVSPVQNWTAVASSADGTRWVAAVKNGAIFTGINSGNVWQSNTIPWDIQNGNLGSTTNTVWESQGVVWTSNNVPVQTWSAVYSSSDGNTLVAVARAGWSYASADGGVTWTQLSTPADFWQSIASSASGNCLLAASGDGSLCLSTNAGLTWNQMVVPANPALRVLTTNVISSDSFVMTVVGTNLNSNLPFTNSYVSNPQNNTNRVAAINLVITNVLGANLIGTNVPGSNSISTDIVLGAGLLGVNLQGSQLFGVSPAVTFSNNLGTVAKGVAVPSSRTTNTFVFNLPVPDTTSLVISNTATILYTNLVAVFDANMAGMNVTITNDLNVQILVSGVAPAWTSVAMSADGTHLVATANFGLPDVPANSAGHIYASTNSGATWQVTGAPNTNWSAVAISADGSHLLASVGTNGLVYTSADSGNSWSALTNLPSANWTALAISANGADSIALAHNGAIYAQQNPPPLSQEVPSLQIQLLDGNVALTWHGGSPDLVLQENVGAGWTDAPETPVVTNGKSQVVLTNSSPMSLYRLKQP